MQQAAVVSVLNRVSDGGDQPCCTVWRQGAFPGQLRQILPGDQLHRIKRLAVMLAEEEVQALLSESRQSSTPLRVSVDVETMTVKSPQHTFAFTMSARHRSMFLQGLDMIGASLSHKAEIEAFAAQHWQAQPWVKDVAGRTKARLDAL